MAERIVAPGVYTKEIDQSFLPGAIAAIGGAVVGPTTKGPLLTPTTVTSFDDYVQIFGGYNDNSYVPYTVAEYFRNGGTSMTVTRVMPETNGYNYISGSIAIVVAAEPWVDGQSAPDPAKFSRAAYITHILHPTNQINNTLAAQTSSIFKETILTPSASGTQRVSGSIDQAMFLRISGSFASQDVFGATYNYTTLQFGLAPDSSSYITKLIGTSPKSKEAPVFVQYETRDILSLLPDTYLSGSSAVSVPYKYYAQAEPFPSLPYVGQPSTAATPWVTSQPVVGQVKRLFKIHTLSYGDNANHEVKVGIRDIKVSEEIIDPDGYPTFVLEVRRVNNTIVPQSPFISNDTDTSPDIVEQFVVNLNPNSSKYINRVVGDRFYTLATNGNLVVNGDYENASKYIRIEVDSDIANKNFDKTLIPFGYEAPISPIPSVTIARRGTSASNAFENVSVNLYPAKNLYTQVIASKFSKNNYFGFDYTFEPNMNYLSPTPSSNSINTNSSAFSLGSCTQSGFLAYPAASPYTGSLQTALDSGEVYFAANIALTTRKFMLPFQGGFDGLPVNSVYNSGAEITATNTFGLNCGTSTASGSVAYRKAFNLLSNADYYDVNMLITPGLVESLHGLVTAEARNLVEERQDMFYILDSNGLTADIDDVKATVKSLDTNYTACYWPWLKIENPVKRTRFWVPPSVLIPSVLAFNDANAAPWYAPAGLNRGGLTTVLDTYTNLSQAQKNALYDNRINPIANFPQTGIAVWGQKTLQARESALDRVNVRRLLIAVKKFIASSTRYLVFEQNTDQTRRRFENIVNPYLASVAANQGLFAFKVIMNEQNNPNYLVDQNILYGQLFLQPTRTAEFILLDFNIQPTGAAFPE